ncbi:MAG: hypothetical protein Q9167_001657 [Letrouitia subvulpina]
MASRDRIARQVWFFTPRDLLSITRYTSRRPIGSLSHLHEPLRRPKSLSSSRAFCPFSYPQHHHRSPSSCQASTSSSASSSTSTILSPTRTFLFSATLVGSVFLLLYIVTDTRATFFHQYLVAPVLRFVYPDAEDAHAAGVKMLKTLYAVGLHPRERAVYDSEGGEEKEEPVLATLRRATAAKSSLRTELWGQEIDCPLAISAGLDKDAEIPDALFALGAGIVEVGGVTNEPQLGNQRPRVWRITGRRGMVNRYGLNSKGADATAARLRERVRRFALKNGFGGGEEGEKRVLRGEAGVPPGALAKGKMLAVQIAKNQGTRAEDDRAVREDYVACMEKVGKYVDMVVVNVSSPNTPGLRELQAGERLRELLGAVVDAARRVGEGRGDGGPKVLVKVSPDEDEDGQIRGIVQAVVESGVHVVVGNTTKRRDWVAGPVRQGLISDGERRVLTQEEGGYSGPEMLPRTLELVGRYRKMLDRMTRGGERRVIFASGGITTGGEALQALRQGADVAMVYTALVYGGSGTVTRMKGELKAEI